MHFRVRCYRTPNIEFATSVRSFWIRTNFTIMQGRPWLNTVTSLFNFGKTSTNYTAMICGTLDFTQAGHSEHFHVLISL